MDLTIPTLILSRLCVKKNNSVNGDIKTINLAQNILYMYMNFKEKNTPIN